MKNKLKKFLLLNCLIGTIFVSCNSEDNYLKEKKYQENLNLQLRKITLKDVESNLKVYEKLTIPKARFKNVGNTNKTINDSINNFSIDSNLGIYIQNGDYHSYTFKINRPNGSIYLLENVVVSKMPNNEYETILYQYNINEYELEQIQNREYIDLTGKINKVLLENSNIANEITGKYYFNGSCWEDYSYYQPEQRCTEGGNHPFSRCSQCVGCGTSSGPQPGGMISGSTVVPCDDDSGAPFIPDQNNPSPGNSYHGANVNTTLSTPVDLCSTCPLFEDDEVSPQDLCTDLATKDANPDFINYMNDLKTRAASQGYESGYTMFQNASLGLQFSPRYDGTPDYPAVNLGIGFSSTSADLNSIGAIHCHLDNGSTYKIFSFQDMIALAEFASISTQPTAQFGIYVVTSSGTFCIKIKNKIQLKDRKNIMIGTQGAYEDKFDKLVDKSKPVDEQVLGFLQFLKAEKFNQSIELFEKDETTNQWNKLELTPNGKDKNPTTC